MLPFVWKRFTVYATGVARVRVRITESAQRTISVAVTDHVGRPVAHAESVIARPVAPGGFSAGEGELFHVVWKPLKGGPSRPHSVESLTALEYEPEPSAVPAAVRAALGRTLDALRDGTPLAVITRNAVATHEGAGVDVRLAPVWGLVRAAQAENPGRLVLVDIDDLTVSRNALAAAVSSGEPEIAIRDGQVLVPRLAGLHASREPTDSSPQSRGGLTFDAARPVLITAARLAWVP